MRHPLRHLFAALCAIIAVVLFVPLEAAAFDVGVLAVLATAPAIAVPDAVKAQLDELSSNIKRVLSLESEIKSLREQGHGTAELKQQVANISERNAELVDALKAARDEMTERQDAFETQMKGFSAGRGAQVSVAEGLIKSINERGMKADTRGARATGAFDASLVTSRKAVTDLAASGGDLLVPQYNEQIITPGVERISLLDLIPQGQTAATSVIFMQEVLASLTNGAAIQTAQGAAKGSSDIVFDQSTAPVRTIAHYFKISTQMLEDVTALRSYIETRGRYMLRYFLEGQVLTGDGTGVNLDGINNQATAFDATLDTAAGVSSPTNLDVIRLAILQVALAHYAPDGIVLHPTDWAGMELLKTSDNAYIFTNPQATAQPRLWGLPVVATTQQTAGDFTVGSFRMGAQLWVRKQATASVATENEDDFIKNLATLLIELRAALTVYRPASFVTGDFTTAKA